MSIPFPYYPATTGGNSAEQPHIQYVWAVACQWCGGWHTLKVCPHVKEIEFHDNGTVKRVVFRNGDEQFNDMKDFLDTLDEH